MSPSKRGRQPTVPLTLTSELVERLDRVASRSFLGRAIIMRCALELGLRAIEADPGCIFSAGEDQEAEP